MFGVQITSNIEGLQQALSALPERITRGVMREISDFAARETLRRYERTTQTWDHHVDFSVQKSYSSTAYSVNVGTDDEIYGYVDWGTRPHWIAPKKPGYPLKFQLGYKAKTVPKVLGSRPGGASGPWARAWAVWHPGTQARRFTAMIREEVGPLVFERAMKAIGEQIRKYIRVRGQKPI